MNNSPAVFMVAGEASADLHGSMVVRELKKRYPGLRIFGIGGPLMVAEGFEAVAGSEEISVMGITEVVGSLPRIIGVARRLLAAVDKNQPRLAILMDLPDFNLRLASFLKKRHLPILYYISPQVWAWRQGRVKKIKKLIDKMLVILPFEAPFYAKHGVQATFVGHPLVEEQHDLPEKDVARNELGLDPEARLVALLPGSRKSEIARHMEPLLAAARLLYRQGKAGQFVIPVATPQLKEQINTVLASFADLPVVLLDGQAQSAILASDVVAVCSGTATLQTALLGRPMVVFYRLSGASYYVLKNLIRVGAISLVNLIAGKGLVKELIQHDFTPENLAAELSALLDDPQKYASLQNELIALKEQLGRHKASQVVADNCAEYLSDLGVINE